MIRSPRSFIGGCLLPLEAKLDPLNSRATVRTVYSATNGIDLGTVRRVASLVSRSLGTHATTTEGRRIDRMLLFAGTFWVLAASGVKVITPVLAPQYADHKRGIESCPARRRNSWGILCVRLMPGIISGADSDRATTQIRNRKDYKGGY